MSLVDLPLELLAVVAQQLPDELLYIALCSRAFLQAEREARGALTARLTPLHTAYASPARLNFCLRDPVFRKIHYDPILRPATRSAAFRAGDLRVIDAVTAQESPRWDHPANAHKATVSIARSGSPAAMQRFVLGEAALLRGWLDTQLHGFAALLFHPAPLPAALESLLLSVVAGGQHAAFELFSRRVRELAPPGRAFSTVWGALFGSTASVLRASRTVLVASAARLSDSGRMLVLLTNEMELFGVLVASALPGLARMHAAAYVLGQMRAGASGCALSLCKAAADSMADLERRVRASLETNCAALSDSTGLLLPFRSDIGPRTLRARNLGAFQFMQREMAEGGWMRSCAEREGWAERYIPVPEKYLADHAHAAFDEALGSDLLFPTAPLRLLARCTADFVAAALQDGSYSKLRDAGIYLRKLSMASTRAGLDCLRILLKGPTSKSARSFYTSPISNEAARLLTSCIRLGLLHEARGVLDACGAATIPKDEVRRYELASHALLACCPLTTHRLREAGLPFSCAAASSIHIVVRRLGKERALALGLSLECVQKAALKRSRVLPCLNDSALFGCSPNQ